MDAFIEKQGFDECFTYFTKDSEPKESYPKVYVSFDNTFNTDISVRLDKTEGYTPENLVFEEIKDKKVEGMKYKKAICDWLNSNFNGKRKSAETNAVRCLNSYLMNNEEGYFNLEAEKLLDEYEEQQDGKEQNL